MALIQYITPTQPVGSTAGTTFYKNATSIAMRSRAYPKRVRSQKHGAVMNLISVLSIFWEQPLTDADRIAWGHYAYNTPLEDAWGNPRFIRGYAHYMRSNRPRLQFGLPRIDAGPTTPGLPPFQLKGLRISPDQSTLSLYYDPADAWATELGAYLMVWRSQPRQVPPARPWEIYEPASFIAGDPTHPPANPIVLVITPTPPLGDYTTWIRTSITRADGRLSL